VDGYCCSHEAVVAQKANGMQEPVIFADSGSLVVQASDF